MGVVGTSLLGVWYAVGGGGYSIFMHGRSCMTIEGGEKGGGGERGEERGGRGRRGRKGGMRRRRRGLMVMYERAKG